MIRCHQKFLEVHVEIATLEILKVKTTQVQEDDGTLPV